MKRTANDICLLCENQKATKKNSHIASKFLGKSILGKKGSRKGYVLDSSKPHIKPRTSQDSPKESFILCPNCEKYFEVLETYVAEHLSKRILNNKFNDCFEYKTNSGGVDFAKCIELNTTVFRLFIVSIFWRCSISKQEPFTNFNIREENRLTQLLNSSIGFDITSISSKDNPSLYKFPIVVMRAKENHDKTGNFLYANAGNEHLYQLILNEYLFFFSLEMNSELQKFDFLNNLNNSTFLVALLRNETWENLRNGLIDLATKKSWENANKMGVKPWNIK